MDVPDAVKHHEAATAARVTAQNRIAELERENTKLREELTQAERRWLSLAQCVKEL